MHDPRSKDTWTVFEIMGEFVEGFASLQPVWPAVSVFGGARIPKGHRYAADASRVAASLATAGFSIITGGGPGVMEAANQGAREAGGRSIVLFGSAFWAGLLEWLRDEPLRLGAISEQDLELFRATDSPEAVAEHIGAHYRSVRPLPAASCRGARRRPARRTR